MRGSNISHRSCDVGPLKIVCVAISRFQKLAVSQVVGRMRPNFPFGDNNESDIRRLWRFDSCESVLLITLNQDGFEDISRYIITLFST